MYSLLPGSGRFADGGLRDQARSLTSREELLRDNLAIVCVSAIYFFSGGNPSYMNTKLEAGHKERQLRSLRVGCSFAGVLVCAVPP